MSSFSQRSKKLKKQELAISENNKDKLRYNIGSKRKLLRKKEKRKRNRNLWRNK
jgi:hypothetical protein